MARKKEKNYTIITLNIDPEIKEKLKKLAEYEGMHNNEFIEFLIENWDAGIDPSNKLKKLLLQRKELVEELNNIEKQIAEVTEQIKLFDEWKKIKTEKKKQAIAILKRKILNKEFLEAENIARVWQRITGIPAVELLITAKNEIEKAGI